MQEQKVEIVKVRVTPEMRMRLDEVSKITGVTIGGFVRTCVDRALSTMYDSNGYLIDAGKISSGSVNKLDGLFPIKDVSKGYNIPYNTIWFAVKSGRVRSVKFNGATYVNLSDVLKRKGQHGNENEREERGRLR